MTDTEINEAIAQECGWTKFWNDRYGGTGWYESHEGYRIHPPQYATDLNAMHEAEAYALRPTDSDNAMQKDEKFVRWDNYIEILRNKVGSDDVAFTTARQRAEALLKALGRWSE